MIALVAALALAQVDAGAVDGGVSVDQLYVKCPDAPLAEIVDGGLFEPWLRVDRNNCKQAACEAYASKKLNEAPSNPGVVLGLIGGGVAAVILGVVVGYLIPHPGPKP